MKFSEDFHAELFLSEPEIADPVEMAFDEDGRVYIAEMLDYPDDPVPGKKALSRIRMVHNGKNTIFAPEVLEVSGLLPWNGGLIVTSAPDILFFKDTNGDGVADTKEVLFTGFPKVNPEGRITNLRLGVDNWIYAANNGADARVTSPKHPDRPVLILRGADFRFRMDKDLIAERASGPAQFGLTMDDFGNRFISQNTIHLRHAVIPMQYLNRAPLVEVPGVSNDVSDHGKGTSQMFPLTGPQQWRVQRTNVRQQRYNENESKKKEYVAGYFTAATGGTIYNGDAFPKEYWGNVFTGDVSGNLIHRDVLKPDGVTFTASRSKDQTEFMASTDVWFRPCNFANAPDGNLYVMDIYREFIETPESIPEEIKKDMDFYSGIDKGRIYRIAPNKPLKKRDLNPNLSKASTADLVKLLEDTNGWHRFTAHRLLIERHDATATPLLEALVASSPSPEARVHALNLLEGDEKAIATALKDSNAGVREHAIRLAENFPALHNAIIAMKDDPELRVRYQVAWSLGTMKDPRTLPILAAYAEKEGDDRWFRAALLTSASDHPADFLKLLMAKGDKWQYPDLVGQLSALIGARKKPEELSVLLAAMPKFKNANVSLAGLGRGLKLAEAKKLKVPGAEPIFIALLAKNQKVAWEAARYFDLPAVVAKADKDAVNDKLTVAERSFAVRALAGGEHMATLDKVLTSNAPSEVQVAAVEALGGSPALLKYWKGYSPEARQRAVSSLLTHRETIPLLLDAIDKGEVPVAAIDVASRARLIENTDQQVSGRAKKLFTNPNDDRAKVVLAHKDVLTLTGDVTRGKKLFEENCGRCHLPRKQGPRVGPDLSGVNNKSKEELLQSILNPSYAIEPRFVNYMVTTKDGRMFDGVIGNETPGAITLRGGSEEGDITILRQNISEVRSSNISLMPDELEKTVNKQGLADIIAYLRAGL